MYTSCFSIMACLVTQICLSMEQIHRIEDAFIRMTLRPVNRFDIPIIRTCDEGFYGLMCTSKCSSGCQGNVCGKLGGTCECRPYFTGDKCSKCISGRFGLLCMDVCPKNCVGCDKVNGMTVCSECKYLYSGGQCQYRCWSQCASCTSHLSCERCLTGYYGSSCRFKCPSNCQNNSCEIETGHCTCKEHYTGSKCNTCVPGRYGVNCSNSCSSQCQSCDSMKRCLTCKSGFYGSRCDKVCSIGCDKGMCDINGTCSCRNNFTGEKCDNCKTGYFGESCNKACPGHCYKYVCYRDSGVCAKGCTNCLDNACVLTSGICLKGCVANRYGDKCDKICPETCLEEITNGSRCSKKDGSCTYGCVFGYFGLNCTYRCDEHCSNKECNSLDGHCLNGCVDGFEEHGISCKPVNTSPETYQPRKTTLTTKVDTVTIVVLATSIPLLMCVVLGIIAYCIKRKFGHSTKSDNNIDKGGLPRTSGTNEVEADTHIKNRTETSETYQSLEADRADQSSYASSAVNLTEGVVTVVPGKTDANKINTTDMVPDKQMEKCIYGNVTTGERAANCNPVIGKVEQTEGEESVEDKCYEIMDNGYMDMTLLNSNSVTYPVKQNGAESNINDSYIYDNI